VAERTLMPSGVDLVYCVGGIGGVDGGKDFHAIRGGFGTLCKWNWGVWVVGRTFISSWVDLVHYVGGIGGCG
jgi:hypothetical protein